MSNNLSDLSNEELNIRIEADLVRATSLILEIKDQEAV